MNAAIYSPYLDTFGGGERYMMTIAEILSGEYRTDVLLDCHLESLGADFLKRELSKRFNINLANVEFIPAPLGIYSSQFNRFFFLKKYDVLFYLTDGSLFFSSAKKNILHIQSPITSKPSEGMLGKIKLRCWDLIIFNSYFTKKHIEKNWPVEIKIVVYPPVDIEKIKPLEKKKYILSVGRFYGYLKDKKHSLLIEAFEELYKEGKLKEWSLHLIGGASEGDKIYLEELKNKANDFPVSFYPNLEFDKLVTLYGESSIYWHASGFGENDPSKMEHFGISTVEAMAGGCVPIVINKGGQTEIVKNVENGFLWNSKEELKSQTTKLIKDDKLRSYLSENAISESRKFSKKRFREKLMSIVKK